MIRRLLARWIFHEDAKAMDEARESYRKASIRFSEGHAKLFAIAHREKEKVAALQDELERIRSDQTSALHWRKEAERWQSEYAKCRQQLDGTRNQLAALTGGRVEAGRIVEIKP